VIDLRAARNDPTGTRAALARKGAGPAFDALMAADEAWRALIPGVDTLRSRAKLKGKPTPEQLEELTVVKAELQALEARLAAAEAERDRLLDFVPNLPHLSAPDGGEDDFVVLREVGTIPELAGPKEHTELGRFDMERAARLSGARFGYTMGAAALLQLAVFQLAISRLAGKGYTPVLPPVLVREEAMYGTGFLPTDAANLYKLETDELYLTGTSEVALAGIHMGEILSADELPARYSGWSTCFRREAGAAGKDTRGMFRLHQFDKIEMFVFCRPEESYAEHNAVLANEEELLQALELPYRVILTAAGDLGASAAKKYDCEAWFPAQGRYREVTSASNTTDFQARRLGIRFRGEKGVEPLHTLNGTAVTGRAVMAVLENHQQPDGSVNVPEALWAYGAPRVIEPGQ
jgi:seryl-tRNA synthetase